MFLTDRIPSQAFQIHGAPSDSTATSSVSNTPFRHPNCSRRAAERALADDLIAKLGIKTTGMEQFIRELSGGSQQKF